MYRRQVVLRQAAALRGRRAREFHELTRGFRARAWLDDGRRRVDAQSMIGLLAAEPEPGRPVLLLADGPDERESVHAMEAFLLQP